MSKQFKGILVFSLFLLCLVILVLFIEHNAAKKLRVSFQMPPSVIIAQPVQNIAWQTQVQAVGTLMAIQGVMMQSTGAGPVTGIFFQSGQYVKAGQALFQLNPGLDRIIINAPFDGQLGLKQVDLGSYVSPGTQLVNIEDTDPMKVQFFVPQTYVGDLALGQTVTFTVDAYPNKTFTGKVFAIDAQLDSDTRGLAVWASIPNPNHELVPGTYAKVTLYTSGQKPVLVVPQTAIGYAFNGEYVYRVGPGGKAIKTTVVLGERRGDNVSILKGLKPSDVIVAVGTGMEKFGDGSQLLPEGTPQYQQFMQAMVALSTGKMTIAQLQAKQKAAQAQKAQPTSKASAKP